MFETNIYNAFQYTESNRVDSYPFIGVRNTYMGGGYVFKMNGNTETMTNQTQLLRKFEWIDKQTSAIFIEFTLFNTNINLFHSCLILFEILDTGSFVNSAQFKPIDLYDLSNSGLLSFKILINIVYLIFVTIFMAVEIRELMKVGAKYFKYFYNYIELFIIGFSWTAFSMYLYRLYSSYNIYDHIRNKSPAFSGKFINLQYVTSCDEFLNMFLGFCATFATLRFIKLLRFNKRVILFLIAFKKSLNELASFGVVFLILWMAFVQAIYLLLNNESYEFSSLPNSMYTCFQIILGKFNGDTFYSANSILAPFLFVAYNIFIIFVMINIFVSILIDNLHLAYNDQELDKEDPEFFSYLKTLFNSVVCFWREKKSHEETVYKDFWDSLPNRFDAFLNRFRELVSNSSLKTNIQY